MIEEITYTEYTVIVSNSVPRWDTRYSYYEGYSKYYVERGINMSKDLGRSAWFKCDTRKEIIFIQETDITESSVIMYNRQKKLEMI